MENNKYMKKLGLDYDFEHIYHTVAKVMCESELQDEHMNITLGITSYQMPLNHQDLSRCISGVILQPM